MERTSRLPSRKTVAARILEIYKLYHRPEYIGLDPLIVVKRFTRSQDLEIAGLVAAVLSYGRVETIIRNCNDIFGRMGNSPFRFSTETSLAEKKKAFRGFKHRFNDGVDIALFLEAVNSIIDECGSIEAFFADAVHGSSPGIAGALDAFSESVQNKARKSCRELPPSFRFLVPSPAGGGACKRMNMYLRWMVRPDDGIDRGIWKLLTPAQLVMPVDTHVAAIARRFGITVRKTADWRMAEEITACLRTIDPFDPVRFDFSLCRRGMLDLRKDAA